MCVQVKFIKKTSLCALKIKHIKPEISKLRSRRSHAVFIKFQCGPQINNYVSM